MIKSMKERNWLISLPIACLGKNIGILKQWRVILENYLIKEWYYFFEGLGYCLVVFVTDDDLHLQM